MLDAAGLDVADGVVSPTAMQERTVGHETADRMEEPFRLASWRFHETPPSLVTTIPAGSDPPAVVEVVIGAVDVEAVVVEPPVVVDPPVVGEAVVVGDPVVVVDPPGGVTLAAADAEPTAQQWRASGQETPSSWEIPAGTGWPYTVVAGSG